MTSLSVKEYLSLKMPTDEAPVSDHNRIMLALGVLGYEHVTIPLHILRNLYPMCRDAKFDITVTLLHREHDWVVTMSPKRPSKLARMRLSPRHSTAAQKAPPALPERG